MPGSGDSVELIVKLVGEACNINCYYCYEKRKPTPDVGPSYIEVEDLRSVLHGELSGHRVSIQLHGGEPLMYGQARMVELLRALADYDRIERVQMQTNATMLNDRWLDLFDEHCPHLEIGISIDGPGVLNRFRVNYADRDTLELVRRAVSALDRRARPFGLIAVISQVNIAAPKELMDFCASMPNLVSVNLVPCFDIGKNPAQVPSGNVGLLQIARSSEFASTSWTVSPREFAAYLDEVVRYWRDSGHFRSFALEPFVSAARKQLGRPTGSCTFSDNKCSFVYTLYPGGRLTACDEIEDYALSQAGGQSTDLAEFWDVAGAQYRSEVDQLTRMCEMCPINNDCGGGCVSTRLSLLKQDRHDEYCNFRFRFTALVKEMLANA